MMGQSGPLAPGSLRRNLSRGDLPQAVVLVVRAEQGGLRAPVGRA